MIDSMESWKAETTFIKSRCGFCDMDFTSWNERCDHLAKHFKAGAKMKEWKGCRGFDEDVARHVTNAMPPFLIGNEALSPIPFSATNEASYSVTTMPLFPNYGEGLMDLSAQTQPEVWNQPINCSAMIPFSDMANQLMPPMSDSMTALDLLGSAGINFGDQSASIPRISTCWEILTLRLGQFVREKIQQGELITDEMLQRQARWILYENDDAWNQTAADNPEWLELFKKGHGLPSTATDEYVDMMEDLGVGVGELNFDTILQDSSWDIRTEARV
jgi:hypothetical protein